jgi:hypothetical protein
MEGFHPQNGQIVLTADSASPQKKVIHKEEQNLHYPIYGVVPPVAGKGKAIYFKTTDPESHSTLVELGTLLNAAHKELEAYRVKCQQLQEHADLMNRVSQNTTGKKMLEDLKKDEEIIHLRKVFIELLSNTLFLVPIHLQTSSNGGEFLDNSDIIDDWMTKAKIPYKVGEIKPKRYYRTDKGSF